MDESSPVTILNTDSSGFPTGLEREYGLCLLGLFHCPFFYGLVLFLTYALCLLIV